MNLVASKRALNLFRGDATAGGPSVPAALASVIGLAVVGYGVAKWAAGDERPDFPAQAVNSSAAVSGKSDSPRPADRPQSESVSDLELFGLVTSGRTSIAIIAEPGGRSGIYRIGDRIRPGVMLEEVLRDGVVLAVGDVRQLLPLVRKAKAANSTLEDGQPVYTRAEMVVPAKVPAGADASPRRRPNFSPEVLRQAAMVPDPAGGFRIRKVVPDSLYARMGLRQGDVLRSANGQPIDSPEQLMLLYQQLSNGGKGEVEVLRERRPEALQFGGS